MSVKIKKYLGKDYKVIYNDKYIKEISYPLRVRLMPDYSEALFWDEEELGCCVGDSIGIYSLRFPEYIQKRLREWYDVFDYMTLGNYERINSPELLRKLKLGFPYITEEAIEICKLIKKEYEDLIEIKYWKPFEDPDNNIDGLISID
ncbi:MAG: hypothetical protein N2510_09425 [Ignavibacteria bacterium]|nr:hypothetical protein [Ignavibacteria bacterium]